MNSQITICLNPTEEQSAILEGTIQYVNEITNRLSLDVWKAGVYKPGEIHKAFYEMYKLDGKLSTQHLVKMFRRVADAYMLGKDFKQPFGFEGFSAIPYDSKSIAFTSSSISINTLEGRLYVKYNATKDDQTNLAFQQGISWLFCDHGLWKINTQYNSDWMNNDVIYNNDA